MPTASKSTKSDCPIRLLFLRTSANLFAGLPLDAGKDAEISAGVTAAGVPSAGITPYQTDFAFLPV
jgi:hypothetical protein